MPRINLRNIEALIGEATAAAVAKLAAERNVDKGHIAEHVEAAKQTLDRLTLQERQLIASIEETRAEMLASLDQLIGGIKLVFDEMRRFEEARLKSLEEHVADFADEPAIEKPVPLKRIRAAE